MRHIGCAIFRLDQRAILQAGVDIAVVAPLLAEELRREGRRHDVPVVGLLGRIFARAPICSRPPRPPCIAYQLFVAMTATPFVNLRIFLTPGIDCALLASYDLIGWPLLGFSLTAAYTMPSIFLIDAELHFADDLRSDIEPLHRLADQSPL